VKPLVVIVGAPNVGKSRLFNRLTGRASSIVHDLPGVTRDRLEEACEWLGYRFRIADTGGLVPAGLDELTEGVRRQVLKAIKEASLLVFVVDGRLGRTPLDESLARLLRKSSRPLLLAVNKVDAPGQEGRLTDFFPLGFPDPLPISAEEGRGLGILMDAIVGRLGPAPPEPIPDTQEPAAILVAVVGRPNVGKSTLFNRLVGDEQAVVASLPGTTRDAVKGKFVHGGRRYTVVDTAGMRRKAGSEAEVVEMQSVAQTLSVLREADLAVVLTDALEPVTHQDLAVFGACRKVRRPTVVALNKVDLIPAGGGARNAVRERLRSRLPFAEETPLVALSALRNEGILELLETLDRMAGESSRWISTPDLNRALEEAVRKKSPVGRDKIPRLYYITQTGVFPPSFVVFTSGAVLQTSYRRYLARYLRQALGFALTPVALRFRRKA